jgi:C-terminal processing protease CtpA/Prc
MPDFVRWAEPVISADGLRDPWKWVMLGKWFHIYAALRFGFPKSYVVTYLAPGKSEPLRAELRSIERKVILEDYDRAPFRVPSADSNLSFEIIKDRGMAVLAIGHFSYYQDEELKRYKSFVDDAFVQIRRGDIKNLILDLRGNDGGSPFATAHLLSYLEAKPVPYFAKEYGGGYEVLAKPVPRSELPFDGRLFTLIDGGCFSSTGHFCGLLKYHKIGVLVGTETGGTFECNDASHLVNLWNTGLRLYVARVTFTAAVQGMGKATGIEPDYPVEPHIEDVINGRDTIKEYALALIHKSKDGMPEGEHHRSVFPYAFTKGIRWLFGAVH